MPALRSLLASLLAFCCLLVPARATWSIVVIDLATGEIAIGIATCLTGFDLRPNAIVVVPGYGAAAAQSVIGPLSLRQLIRTGLLNGTQASQILAQLAAADAAGHQSRQYGIVSLQGGALTFTGSLAGSFAGGVTGQLGTLRYAIQGNVLTGVEVVQAAEAALTIPGTLADKVMAAMQAARIFGGDGRCSCNASAPTSCGAPPASFTKCAHTALMIVARPGDVDAACTTPAGCGAGQYWLDLNVANQPVTAVDPVAQLQTQYDAWKLAQIGRPDHFQSTVTMSGTTLRADGVSTVTGTVVLRDAQGNPLGNNLAVSVSLASNSTVGGITFGAVTPQANGSYTFTMTGNLDAGDAVLDVAAFDTLGRIGISPRPVVQLTNAFGTCGTGGVVNGAGAVFDVLRVDGAVTSDRVATVGFGQPFTIALDAPGGLQPPLPAPVGLFALWLHAGLPIGGIELPFGPTQGSLCFTPAPFAASPSLLLADSFGLGGLIPAASAPWTLPLPGVPLLFDATLQGAMVTDTQPTLAATNAVLLRVVPLPPPGITSIVPISPAVGQLVTVTGSNFLPGVETRIAGNVVANTLVGATQLTFTMPAGVPCDAPLTVANLGSSPAQTTINASPLITSLPFLSGTRNGGATFVVIGQRLLGATVTIGGAPLTITSQTATVIVGTTPPGTPGPAQVIVSNPVGCQATGGYTYL